MMDLEIRKFIHQFYKSFDQQDMDCFLAFFKEDSKLRLPHRPEAESLEEIRIRMQQFHEVVRATKHTFRNIWMQEGTLLIESEVRYRRMDGGTVIVPSFTIIMLDDELKVNRATFYADISHVLEPRGQRAAEALADGNGAAGKPAQIQEEAAAES